MICETGWSCNQLVPPLSIHVFFLEHRVLTSKPVWHACFSAAGNFGNPDSPKSKLGGYLQELTAFDKSGPRRGGAWVRSARVPRLQGGPCGTPGRQQWRWRCSPLAATRVAPRRHPQILTTGIGSGACLERTWIRVPWQSPTALPHPL